MLGPKFEQAVVYAAIVHGDQTRKQPDTVEGPRVPYLAHLLGVASLVLEDRGGEEEAIAALLHDAVEDRGGIARLTDVRLRFGERVADIVEGCSDAALEAGKKKREWLPRKQAYIRHLDHLDSRIEPAVLRVSMADKLYNLRATVRDARRAEDRGAFWDIFKTKAPGQVWYYRELAAVYRRRCPDSILLSELDDLMSELETVVSDEDRALAAEYARMHARAPRDSAARLLAERRVIHRQVGETDITIVAFVDADGSAGIDGQDLGDGPTSLVGSDEYEYGIRVSPDDVPKLRALLEARLTAEARQTASPAPSLVDLLEATFGSRADAVSALNATLKRHSVRGEFWSYP